MLITMFCIVVRVVGIAAVIQGTAWGFEQIVHRAIVHAVRQYASCFLIGRQGDQCRAVESVKCMNFNVFYLHYVARFNDDATLFRYAPANPQINAGFRSNERYVISTVLHHGSSDVNVDMIVVIVSRQYRVDLANRKRIKNKRGGAQVWLQFFHASHALHLVTLFH